MTDCSGMMNCPNYECESDHTGVYSYISLSGNSADFVQCLDCYARGPDGENRREAIRKWNALSTRLIAGDSGMTDRSGVYTVSSEMAQCPNSECRSSNVELVSTATGAFCFGKCLDCYMSGPHDADSYRAIERWNALSDSEHGWMSVEDGLPEPRTYVLLSVTGENKSVVGYLIDYAGAWCVQPTMTTWHKTRTRVTHWQPLPDLPVIEPPIVEKEIDPSVRLASIMRESKALIDWLAAGEEIGSC